MSDDLTIRRQLAAVDKRFAAATGFGKGHWLVSWGEPRWIDCASDERFTVVVDGKAFRGASRITARDLLTPIREDDRWCEGLGGEFIIAVIDLRADSLRVVRDPLGARPWYHANAGARYVGSTRLPSVTEQAWVGSAINEEKLAEQLAGIFTSTGPTLYRAVSSLPPGHSASVTARSVTIRREHSFDFKPRLDVPWDDAVEIARSDLSRATVQRADSELASCELSGGLDSSTIVGLLASSGRRDLVVGRMLFDDPKADERSYSDAVIAHFDLDEISVSPWTPDPDEADELMTHLGTPIPPTNGYMSVALLRAFARRGRFSVLTGTGGDHAFASASVGARVAAALLARDTKEIRRFATWAIKHPRRTPRALIAPTIRVLSGHALQPSQATWLRPAVRSRFAIEEKINAPPAPVSGIRALDERWAPIIDGSITATLESNAAIASYAGVRQANPMLDPGFIQAVYGLSPHFARRTNVERALQRHAFASVLPPAVRERRTKAEFSRPTLDRFERRDPTCLNGRLAQLDWLDPRGTNALIAAARAGHVWSSVIVDTLDATNRWLSSQPTV